ARSHDRRIRPKSPAVQKNRPSRFHPRQNAPRTSPGHALLRNPVWLHRKFSARARTAQTPPLLCLAPKPSAPSHKPPRSVCSFAQKKRVLLWRKLKTELLDQRAKFRRLLRCQGMRVRLHLVSRTRSTFNFQRATFNDLLNSTSARENIRSWTLSACQTVVLRRRVERCTFLPT